MTQHIFICTFISINTCRVNSWRKSIFQCSTVAWLRDYIQIPSAQVVRVSVLFTFGRWCLHGSPVCFRNSKVLKCLLMCTGPFLPRKTSWLKRTLFFSHEAKKLKAALNQHYKPIGRIPNVDFTRYEMKLKTFHDCFVPVWQTEVDLLGPACNSLNLNNN